MDENGKFVRFFEGWVGGRKYALDMAGFAVSVKKYVEVKMKYVPKIVDFQENFVPWI